MSLVTKMAPDFCAPAVMPNNQIDSAFKLSEYRAGSMALVFFYPLDFTFVCPSEIIAFNKRVEEFKQRNVKVIGVSVDSQFTHLAWKKTPISKGGIGEVGFPLVADLTKSISESYEVLIKEGISLRGTFLIDVDGIIRHALVNDLPLGRNVEETLRTIDALIHHKQYGDVCPAGWNKGKEAMKATASGVEEYLSKHADKL